MTMRATPARFEIQREITMNFKSTIATALTVATLAGSLVIPTSAAQAGHHGGWGIGAGLVGAAVVGSAIAASSAPYGGYYVDGYRRCRLERQYDAAGFYIGTAKVCRVY
jgi:hypothetical protein